MISLLDYFPGVPIANGFEQAAAKKYRVPLSILAATASTMDGGQLSSRSLRLIL
jgi:hypothetical protein